MIILLEMPGKTCTYKKQRINFLKYKKMNKLLWVILLLFEMSENELLKI